MKKIKIYCLEFFSRLSINYTEDLKTLYKKAEKEMKSTELTKLHNGIIMPWIGLGVFQMEGKTGEKKMLSSLH